MATMDLTHNAAFMDLYSRQIGAYGIETMGKLVKMRVLIEGLRGAGIEAAKNLILAGPGSVILHDDDPTEIKDMGTNFFLTSDDVGKSRASCCEAKLQELNSLVKVSVYSGDLTEDFVGTFDVVVFTNYDQKELIRWNNFCRNREIVSFDERGHRISRLSPIRFIAVGTLGALGYIFSDFGPEFTVHDQTGEPPVQRVITNITCASDGVVSILNPNESELAKKVDIADTEHEGYVSFSEVDGMYCKEEHNIKTFGHSINSSGVWRAHEVWTRVPDELIIPKERGGDGKKTSTQFWVHETDPKTGDYKKDRDRPDGLYWKPLFIHECKDVPEKDFVRDEHGNKLQRMTDVKDHYKVKIGNTSGFSKYCGGGILQQTYQPVVHKHKSLEVSLQQPIGLGENKLLSCDGEKEALNWWYPMLHIVKQGVFQFYAVNRRLPLPNNIDDCNKVLQLAKDYNQAMITLGKFCGSSVALATIDLTIPPRSPPTASNLDESKRTALEDLKNMGTPEVKALLALEECCWNIDDAMMLLFDEDSMTKLESSVNVYHCLQAMKKLVLACGAELQPMAVFMGGICAQEVVKHCGKFLPLNQWFHFDCIEVLPDELSVDEYSPLGSRYDDNIALFGKSTQAKLKDLKAFMVGCGALGCELLKNFALLGIGCGSGGRITVTDGDRIEVSNLNRQFLFRKQHVKKSKSTTAAEAVLAMNPNINVDSLELLAMKETENVFNDDFWLSSGKANNTGAVVPCSASPKDNNGINIVINALDNIKARKYMDSRCVYYHKPLLESGTEGTKFNHQVIIPDVTASYDEGQPDAQEGEAIPMCTLRNFPSTIIHCIEWARGLFEDLFVSPINDFSEYLKDPKGYISKIREDCEAFMLDQNEIQSIRDKLSDKEGNGLLKMAQWASRISQGGQRACVEISIELFLTKFNFSMKDLQYQFPKDYMTNGKLFWSPPKRYPTELDIDMSDEFVSCFIVSVSNLLAVAFGLNPLPVNGIDQNGNDFDTFVPVNSHWRDTKVVQEFIPKLLPKWSPSSLKIETDEKSNEEKTESPTSSIEDETNKLIALLDELSGINVQGISAQPADFEKDLDLNFHIDFVAAASNLRASNYGIPRATRHKTKMIAGKIIAAIATSTACATALVCIELLKLVQNKSKTQFRDSSNNFAVNQFQMSEPQSAIVYKDSGEKQETPDPQSQSHLYDSNGDVIWHLVPTKKWKAYPSPHTKWMSLEINGNLSLEQAIQVLKFEHNLKLMSWFVTIIDDNGKTVGKQIYSEPAIDSSIDEELLLQIAPLSLSQQKAIIAISRCSDMKNKQSYTQRWNILKQREGDEFKSKMQSSMRSLLENFVGSLSGYARIELETSLEIASEPGVEAVTPPIVLVF